MKKTFYIKIYNIIIIYINKQKLINMSNLVIEKDKLCNRLYRSVYDIIVNEYTNGNLEVYSGQYTMYAYFFEQRTIQNSIRL